MKTDRELLELAAKGAGYTALGAENQDEYSGGRHAGNIVLECKDEHDWPFSFAPLTDDGDALRLAVKLKIRIGFVPSAYADTPAGLRFFGAHDGDDQFSRTRLAIARAAAAIGRAIRTQQCGRPHDPPYQGSAS